MSKKNMHKAVKPPPEPLLSRSKPSTHMSSMHMSSMHPSSMHRYSMHTSRKFLSPSAQNSQENTWHEIFDEAGLNYEQRRIIDLVEQVLNRRLNVLQEFRNVSDLFRLYGQVLQESMSKTFDDSMKSSEKALFDVDLQKKALAKLETDNPHAFLLVPIMAYGHMFAANIRKRGSAFSVTLVNKGARGHHQQFEEYRMSQPKLNGMLEALSAKTDYKIEQIYAAFEKNAISHHRLAIYSRNQKVGNCFIKEPETAIKYSVATRDMKNSDFENMRLRFLHPKEFRVTWDIPTLQMHARFVKEIIKEHPAIQKKLSATFEIYAKNKQFRERIQQQLPLHASLEAAFDPNHQQKNRDASPEAYTKSLLRQINYDTLMQHGNEIGKLTQGLADSKFVDIFRRTKYYAEHSKNFFKSFAGVWDLMQLPRIFDLHTAPSSEEKVITNLEVAAPYFPHVVQQIRLDYHAAFFISGVSLAMKGRFDEALEKINLSNALYPYHPVNFAFRSLIYAELGDMPKAFQDVYHALELNPEDDMAKRILEDYNAQHSMQRSAVFKKFSDHLKDYIRFFTNIENFVPDRRHHFLQRKEIENQGHSPER